MLDTSNKTVYIIGLWSNLSEQHIVYSDVERCLRVGLSLQYLYQMWCIFIRQMQELYHYNCNWTLRTLVRVNSEGISKNLSF